MKRTIITASFILSLFAGKAQAQINAAEDIASQQAATAASVLDAAFRDLAFDSINVRTTVWVKGQRRGVGLIVSNLGDQTVGNAPVRVFLSGDEDISANDSLLADASTGPIPAGGRRSAEATFVVPDVTPGPYFVLALVDPDTLVAESDETNNVGIGNLVVNVLDALAPADVVGGGTPFLRVKWGTPINPAAPVIFKPAIEDLDFDCTLPSGRQAQTYAVSGRYADRQGDFDSDAEIRVFISPGLFGAVAFVDVQSLEVGEGFFSFDVCVRFADAEVFDLTFSLNDAAGNSSTFFSFTLLADGSIRQPEEPVSSSAAFRFGQPPLQDGDGMELSRYEVYRVEAEQSDPVNDGVLLRVLSPADTQFVDHAAVPGQSYTYATVAVFNADDGLGADRAARKVSSQSSNLINQSPGNAPNASNDIIFETVSGGTLTINAWDSFGGAWGDYDNDERLDLYVVNGNRQANILYEQHGNGDYTEASISINGDEGNSYAASWGDFDNDGDADLFVANWIDDITSLGSVNFLYRNEGNGTFARLHDDPMSPFRTDRSDSYSGSWGDYNNDGWLDLFVANSNVTNLGAVGTRENYLYRNDNGTFTKMTGPDVGSFIEDDQDRSSMGVWGDYNNDGYLDLFAPNLDTDRPNPLYRNNGDGTFSSVDPGASRLDDRVRAMGASWGDYNNDGFQDLYVTVWSDVGPSDQNLLYRNEGVDAADQHLGFTKISVGDAVNDQHDSYGSSWLDFDNDGDLDLMVVNQNMDNDVYENDEGRDAFNRLANDVTVSMGGNSHGSMWGDFSQDGFADVFVSNNGGNFLYRNKGAGGPYANNRFLRVQCIGAALPTSPSGDATNRSAMGAKVWVTATINGQPVTQMREISGQTGRGGQNGNLPLVFGLGDATMIDEIRVAWPSGKETLETMRPVTNQTLIIPESGSVAVAVEATEPGVPAHYRLHQNYPNPFNPITTIAFAVPQSGPLTLKIYTVLGEEVATLVNRRMPAGQHDVVWDASSFASGVYYYRLVAGVYVKTKKLILLK